MKPIVNVATGEVTVVERDPAELARWEAVEVPESPEERIAELEAVINALLETP